MASGSQKHVREELQTRQKQLLGSVISSSQGHVPSSTSLKTIHRSSVRREEKGLLDQSEVRSRASPISLHSHRERAGDASFQTRPRKRQGVPSGRSSRNAVPKKAQKPGPPGKQARKAVGTAAANAIEGATASPAVIQPETRTELQRTGHVGHSQSKSKAKAKAATSDTKKTTKKAAPKPKKTSSATAISRRVSSIWCSKSRKPDYVYVRDALDHFNSADRHSERKSRHGKLGSIDAAIERPSDCAGAYSKPARILPARPTNSPLHASASPKEINNRLVALNSLSCNWAVAERAISFKTTAGRARSQHYEDVTLSMTEKSGAKFFDKALPINAALFCADSVSWTVTVAQGRRHWFAGMTVRDPDSWSKIVIIFHGDAQQCWDQMATDNPSDYGAAEGFRPMYVMNLTHQQ